MSLRPEPVPPIPEETRRAARGAFPKGHPYLRMRDEFQTFFTDDAFGPLFARRGQPAEAPWRLALVTILQFAENLSDRQAADAVRSRIDWKYLLSLELADPGFDYSVLCEFRDRLLRNAASLLLLETLLERFRERHLLKERSPQRTDSTHVLAAVRTLNRLELAGESMRGALNALAVAAPEWLREQSEPAWLDRYGRRFADQRLPKGGKERTALAHTIGRDGIRLLSAVYAPAAPEGLRAIPAVQTLRQVWVEQFYREGAQVRWRQAADLPPAGQVINSPYDPAARYAKKRETEWVGYKVHLTETCAADRPLLITDVQTTLAPVADSEVLPTVHAALQQRDLLPGTHLVDAGYPEAATLVASREQYGIDLVGPVGEDRGWQAREATGFAAREFTIDWDARSVRCPAGKQSVAWRERERRSGAVIKVDFAQRECEACAHRAGCTRAVTKGRQLTLLAQTEHEAVQTARQRQGTEAFAELYATRAGVEGTHSQGVRRCGLRECRYIGLAKVHLQHLLTGAALNFVRVAVWLMGTPRARTRESAFIRLMAAA